MSALLASPIRPSLRECPSLQNGDHLDAAEFMRRYEAMEARGDYRQAELINGIVYLMFPAHFESHGESDSVGVIRSRYFEGLWLNVPALLALDRRGVLRTLEEGLRAAGKM